jgi:plasmid stabilization system protein ParE
LNVIFRETALADLESIFDWIARDSPVSARSVVERILDAVETRVALFPLIGRTGKKPNTRE